MIDMRALETRLWAAGHGDDIEWAETLKPPADSYTFAFEIIFVICNSGMHHKIARVIYEKVMNALAEGNHPFTVFKHTGKALAINTIWLNRNQLFDNYFLAEDKLAWLEALPWIGKITKYHCAKNFGLQYAKPDVHLQRLADTFKTTPQSLCEALAKTSGYKVATVDTMLWRAAAVGILDTRTGKLT